MARPARDADFIEFARDASHRLQRSAFLLCRDWHLAQDLTQAALTKVYLAWKRIGGTGPDRFAYARTVLMRQFLDHRRLRSSTEVVVAEGTDGAAGPDDPALRLTLLEALATLPPRDRAILVLRYWEDQSVADTAYTLNITQDVVRTRSARALGQLRSRLGVELSLTGD